MLKDINEVLKRLKNVKLTESFSGDRMLREIVNLVARQLERDEHGDVTHKEFDRIMKMNAGPINVMIMSALENYAGIHIGGAESADSEESFRDAPEPPEKDLEPKPELKPEMDIGGEDFVELPKSEVPIKREIPRKGISTPSKREMPRRGREV